MQLHNRPLFDHSRNCKREMAVNLTRHPPLRNVETILSEVITPFSNIVIQLCAPCTAKFAGDKHRAQVACAYSKDSDQYAHLHCLVRVVVFGLKKRWALGYPLKAQIRLRMRAV